MSDLTTALENSVKAYNELSNEINKAQQELLMRQGAIQQLQALINDQEAEETEVEE